MRSSSARAKSAALWGVVGALSFLVLAQGYLLVEGDLPFRYSRLFLVGAGVGTLTSTVTYLTEHRLRGKRRV